MSISVSFDDSDYSDDYHFMILGAKYDKLRNVIRNTYISNKKTAEELVRKADEMTDDTLGSKLNAADIRAQAIGMMNANITLMKCLIEFGFGNDIDLIKEDICETE